MHPLCSRQSATERRLSLTDIYTSTECFTTGTMGGLAPVGRIDGRVIGTGGVGPVTKKLQQAYDNAVASLGSTIPE